MADNTLDKQQPALGFWASLWQDVGHSIYDIRCFGELSGRSVKYAYKVLAVLVLLCAAADTAVFAAHFFPLFSRVSKRFIADVDKVEIKGGKLSLEVAQPYVLEDKDLGRVVIDTTGTVSAPDEKGGLLITDTAVFASSGDGEASSKRDVFSKIADMSADRAKMEEWCSTMRASIAPLVGFFAILSHGIRKLFHVFVLAFMGFLYTRIRRAGRDMYFSQVFVMSVFSLCAPVGLSVIVVLSGIRVPGFALAYIACLLCM